MVVGPGSPSSRKCATRAVGWAALTGRDCLSEIAILEGEEEENRWKRVDGC